jgi:hypothetical protein
MLNVNFLSMVQGILMRVEAELEGSRADDTTVNVNT